MAIITNMLQSKLDMTRSPKLPLKFYKLFFYFGFCFSNNNEQWQECVFAFGNHRRCVASDSSFWLDNISNELFQWGIVGWLLFDANSSIFQLYHGENKLICNEMMIRSSLLKTNTPGWIFIVLAHWNSSLKQQSADRHVAPLQQIILIPSQPVFALSP